MDALHWIGLAWLAWACVWGGFGSYVAAQKGRSDGEGFVFGAILGPIGILVVAILPDVARSPGDAAGCPPEVYQYRPRKLLGEAPGPQSRGLRKLD